MAFLNTFSYHLVLSLLLLLVFLVTIFFSPRPKWLVPLLGVAAAAAVAFTVTSLFTFFRTPQSNYNHYYLGAKYRLDYFPFYTILRAARGEPQENYRDLRDYSPWGFINKEPAQKAEYYRRLLREHGIEYSPSMGVNELWGLCYRHELFKKEGRRILQDTGLSPDRIRQLRADARVGPVEFQDHGFNASPFYVLMRQLDPALYFPLSVTSFRWSIVLEFVLLGLAGMALAKAFDLSRGELLLFFCLVLGSWEFVGWDLLGLVAMAWFLPVCIAFLFSSRGQFALAGAAVSVAALLKIFPIVVATPVVVSLFVSFLPKRSPRPRKEGMAFIAGAVAAAMLLAAVSQTQADWGAWLEKILIQFASNDIRPNNVSIYGTWVLSVMKMKGVAPVPYFITWCFRVLLMAALGIICSRMSLRDATMKGGVLCLAMLPWIAFEMPNYYTLGHAVGLTLLYREERKFFFIGMTLMLANQFLIDYEDIKTLKTIGSLIWVKNAFFLVTPLLMLLTFVRKRSPPESAPLR